MKNRFSKQPQPEKLQPEQPKPTKQEIVKKQLNTIEENILTMLECNSLQISKTKVPFLRKQEKNAHADAMYEKIAQDKKKLEERIKQLENTEKLYLEKSKVMDKSKISPSLLKAQISQEDKQHLKSLRKKLKDFQKSIEQKTIEIQQQRIRLNKQQEQRIQKQKMVANQRKRIKIQQKLEELKHRTIDREAHKKQQDSVIKKIQQKKKLYELLDQNWKQKYNHEEQKKIQLMELRLREKHVNFSELKQHQKKYQEIIADKKKQLQQKRLLSSSRQSQNSSFSASKSKYYTIVLRQQQEAKQQQEKKKQISKIIQKKRQQYAQYVREEHAPKMKTVQDQQAHKQIEQPKILKKTKQQIKEMGDFNLRQGNKRAKKKQNLDVTNSNSKTISEDQKGTKVVSSSMSHYTDYLKQVRVKKQADNFYNGFHNSPKSEAEKIMKSQKINKQDKIAKLKLLANRFDSSSTDIISRIQGKLQILEVIN